MDALDEYIVKKQPKPCLPLQIPNTSLVRISTLFADMDLFNAVIAMHRSFQDHVLVVLEFTNMRDRDQMASLSWVRPYVPKQFQKGPAWDSRRPGRHPSLDHHDNDYVSITTCPACGKQHCNCIEST